MPGKSLPIVPNDLPLLDGVVTGCGALAPEAVDVMVADCSKGFGRGAVPKGP